MEDDETGRRDEREQISPELVLVDPALRERARLELEAAEPIFRPLQASGPRPAPPKPEPAPVREGLSSRRLLLVGAGLLVLVGAPLAWKLSKDVRSRSGDVSVPHRAASLSQTGPLPGSSVAAAQTPAPRGGARGSCAELSWDAAPGARRYDVVFWRDGRRVLDLWPRQARVAVPAALTVAGRLGPGRYLWFVYPLFGRRPRETPGNLHAYGELVVARGARCARVAKPAAG